MEGFTENQGLQNVPVSNNDNHEFMLSLFIVSVCLCLHFFLLHFYISFLSLSQTLHTRTLMFSLYYSRSLSLPLFLTSLLIY